VMRCNSSDVTNMRPIIIKPSAYLNMKMGGDRSMLIKGK
jgi:hypothetical protein